MDSDMSGEVEFVKDGSGGGGVGGGGRAGGKQCSACKIIRGDSYIIRGLRQGKEWNDGFNRRPLVLDRTNY